MSQSSVSIFQRPTFLRQVLIADAAASLATGLLLLAAATPLSPWLNLPVGLMRGAGLVLLPYVALLVWLLTRPVLSRRAVWLVIGINAVWVVDSLALLLGGFVAPTGWGVAFVVAQAAVVAMLAELQLVGLRRSGMAVA